MPAGTHFKNHPEAAAEAGHKGMARRWGKATKAEKEAEGERLRAAYRARLRDTAYDAFLALGVIPTPEQVEQAADHLRLTNLASAREAAQAALRTTGGPEPTDEEWRNDRTVREAAE